MKSSKKGSPYRASPTMVKRVKNATTATYVCCQRGASVSDRDGGMGSEELGEKSERASG
jgi:hypothetical protein